MTCKVNADTTNGLKLTSDTSGEIDLQIDASTKVHMASDGKLGIGTTSPSSKLTVQDFGNDAALYVGGGLKMDDGPGNPWYLGKGILGSSGSEFLIGNGSNELVRINQSGDVSIGGNDVLTDAAKTLSQNGYQKFSNGYTIQWGKHTSSSSSFTVTYPVAFTTVYSIAVTPFDTGTDTGGVSNADTISPDSDFGNTSFKVSHYTPMEGIYWIATGIIS